MNMKKIHIFLFLLVTFSSFSQNRPFITTWNTGSETNIIIPTTGSGYNYNVDWGDSTTDSNVAGTIEHNYAIPGVYEVQITGDFPRIFFNSNLLDFSGNNHTKINTIEQWGSIKWSSMKNAFSGCVFLKINASDAPDLSEVTDMTEMFSDNISLNNELSNWDSSNVTNMKGLFKGATTFNQDISMWDVANVINMSEMFMLAADFNQNINNWDVSNVVDMSSMFTQSNFNQNINKWIVSNVENMSNMFSQSSFNQNINNWDVSNVENMSNMFHLNESFNNDVSNWDVSSVTTMKGMFNKASAFNIDISDWKIEKVTTMEEMFFNASKFDQNIGSWNISTVANMSHMLDFTAISTSNYDAILNGWLSSSPSLTSDVNFGALGLIYCDGQSSRNELQTTYNWNILNDSNDCDSSSFISIWKTNNFGSSSSNQITIPTIGDGYNYTVNWGDNSSDSNITTDITHRYTIPGTYVVQITGDFPRINFYNFDTFKFEQKDNFKILEIKQWGNQLWTSFENAFFNCENLIISAKDTPNLKNTTNMSNMFFNTNLNTANNIGLWDVSGITNMNSLFHNSTFNSDIKSWNVGNVEAMSRTFSGTPFNQDISNWNVGNVTNMSGMFVRTSFNQDISNWNVSNVTSLAEMFFSNIEFNQDISSWDVSNVKDLAQMFFGATSFNQDIGGWNVSNVGSLQSMFSGASSFDQSLENWDIRNVGISVGLFRDSGLSTANYDSTLRGWAELIDLGIRSDYVISARGITYCDTEARNKLINHGWIIEEDTMATDCTTLNVLDHEVQKNEFTVYPIPAYDKLFVRTNTSLLNAKYKIITLSGKIVQFGKLANSENSIIVNSLSSGVYFLQIENNTKPFTMKKFIKE